MRAAQITEHGGPEVLHVTELPDPTPGEGQVLIDVQAAGINFSDLAQRRGIFPVPGLPCVLGHEAAGVVHGAGPGVRGLQPGDRVVARVERGYASHVVAPADACIPLPDGAGFEEALVLLSQGTTAATLTWEVVAPQPGTTVVVHAAAGGVGTILVQLLKEAGATVIAAVGSAEKLALTTALGADLAVDYSEDGWVDEVLAYTPGGVDWVLASSGGSQGDRSFDVVRHGGTVVMYGTSNTTSSEVGQQRLTHMIFGSKRLLGFSVATFRPERADAVQQGLLERFADGRLEPVIGGRYPLDDVAGAHRDMESRTTHGKLVVLP